MKVSTIHESLVNGQRRQMVNQIDKYGASDFWPEYYAYLTTIYVDIRACYAYFTDATITYFRVKGR